MSTTLPSLDAIQARADAATEGPWWTTSALRPPSVFSGGGSASDVGVLEAFEPADAEFIAHARTDVPALSAAIRDVLALHRPETPRRDPDFHHTDRVCTECGDPFHCRTYTAVTAHIDTTLKEN